VSEIDDPQQTENQGESAGHNEQKRCKRHSIEEL
jgi:hypothetical protein